MDFWFCLFVVIITFSEKCGARLINRLHGDIFPLGDKHSPAVSIVLEEAALKVNDVVFLKQYEMVAKSSASITVENRLVRPEQFFYYIQVHSYLHEVVLTWNRNDTNNERGTNVGQIFQQEDNAKNRTIYLVNPNAEEVVSLMIVLLVYEVENTPIPGSCPQNDSIITPSLNTTTLPDTVSTAFSPSKSVQDKDCGSRNSSLTYEIRFVYFGKNEYSPVVYFDTIRKLIVASGALEYGEAFVGKIDPQHEYRRLFCRYAGMGLFFVVILQDTSNESYVPISYVPGVSYGCPGPVLGEVHCDLIETAAAKAIYVIIMLVGIGIMIFGRGLLFIRATLYSFMIAGFVLYTVHCIVPFGRVAKLTVSSVLGVVLVGTWIRTLLECHAIYRLTDFMASIILGYTFSCLVLFGSADAAFFVSSLNYYLVLSAGVLLITLWYFSLLAVCGVIIMNIMVGCTFIVLTLLFIFDGNLQYAFVNNWRRIRDDDFRFALSFPHLDVVDWISIVLWVVIFCFGLCFQRKCECAGDARRQEPRIFRDPEQRPLIAGVINSGDSNDVFLSPTSNSVFLNSLSERSLNKLI